MACGRRCDLAGHAAETLLNKLFKRPAGAVAGEHRKVVEMYIGVSVSVSYLVVIDLGEPVVRSDGAGVAEYKAADGISYGRILLNAPVGNINIAVDKLFVVENSRLDAAELLALAAIKNVCLCDIGVAGLDEHMLNAVLNILNGDERVLDLGLEISRHLEGEEVDCGGVILLLLRLKRLFNGFGDLVDVEFCDFSVSLYDLVHILRFLSIYILSE